MSADDRPVSRTYSQELGEAICARIAKGEPLAAICRDEGMPSDSTVRRWANPKSPFHVEAFAAELAVAREMGYDAIADECLAIADDRSHDWIEREGKDGHIERAFDAEHVQRSKLRIDARLRLLAKWDPKRYGEKLETTHQAGQSLRELVEGSYRSSPPAPAADVASRGFSPIDGLMLPTAVPFAGGLIGGSERGAGKSSALAGRLEDGNSAD